MTTSGIEAGARAVARRMVNAEEDMIATLVALGDITPEQATAALSAFRKARALKLDAVAGRYLVTHGVYMERDVIRRAAGLE